MKRLMVVDDEYLVRVGLRSILNWEEHGYTIVAEASNGQEALDKVEETKPDIIVTDLMMNKMDGFELIRQCSQLHPHIRFVVLSSYNDFDNVRQAMKLGAADYMFKLDSDPENILKILEEVSTQLPVRQDGDSHLLRKNLPTIKSSLIQKAVQQSYLSEKELAVDFAQLGIATDFFRPYALLYMSVDQFAKAVSDGQIHEQDLLKFSMENIIAEVMQKDYAAEVYNYHGGDLLVIVNTDGIIPEAELCEGFRRSFQTISTYIQRYLGLTISCCLNLDCMGFTDLSRAVKNAETRLCNRLSAESGEFLLYENDIRGEIVQAQKLVKNHLCEDLSITRVATMVNMSESYFSHTFKKDMGVTFTDYVIGERINRAMEMLEKSDLKVNEIAERVGIENTNYFSTLFRKKTGYSPNQYRQKTHL